MFSFCGHPFLLDASAKSQVQGVHVVPLVELTDYQWL